MPAPPGIAAEHFQHRVAFETDPYDVFADLQSGNAPFVIFDVRSREAYEDAHVKGAIGMPHREITEESMGNFSKETLIVVYCWGPACNAAQKAGLRLSRLGFRVKEMIGGFEYWAREGMPIEGTRTADPDLVGRLS